MFKADTDACLITGRAFFCSDLSARPIPRRFRDSRAASAGFSSDFCGTAFFLPNRYTVPAQQNRTKEEISIPEIKISVRDKLPAVTGAVRVIVSDNTDYTVRFTFDSEWNGVSPKTVFFADGASGANVPVVMEGDTCAVPLIPDWQTVLIGVQAGSLHTTRPALLKVFPSIARQMGDPVPQEEFDRWTQIMERLTSPVAKTDAMTQPVGRDADGRLWTVPGGGGSVTVSYDPATGDLSVTSTGSGSSVEYDDTTGNLQIG